MRKRKPDKIDILLDLILKKREIEKEIDSLKKELDLAPGTYGKLEVVEVPLVSYDILKAAEKLGTNLLNCVTLSKKEMEKYLTIEDISSLVKEIKVTKRYAEKKEKKEKDA